GLTATFNRGTATVHGDRACTGTNRRTRPEVETAGKGVRGIGQGNRPAAAGGEVIQGEAISGQRPGPIHNQLAGVVRETGDVGQVEVSADRPVTRTHIHCVSVATSLS